MTQLMWSAAGVLGCVNLVNIEEIPNESVDLVPLGSYLSKLLDLSATRQNTLITLINVGVDK